MTYSSDILFTRLRTDVVRAIDIAFRYRNKFRKDIFIDLFVYRRWYVLIIFSA